MEWFRVFPSRAISDLKTRKFSLEERGFIHQMCLHVALYDGAIAPTPDALFDEIRPRMQRRKFDALWARCASVLGDYLADVSAQVAKNATRSAAGRQAALQRWSASSTTKNDADRNANADANASPNADANADAKAHANAYADRQTDRQRSPLPPKGESAARFARFWSAYPRRTAKAAALKAWTRLDVDDALLEAMLRAIAWQRQTLAWTKDDGAYIPHPSTWLNQRRWEDERPADLATDDDESPEGDLDYDPRFDLDKPYTPPTVRDPWTGETYTPTLPEAGK